MTSFITDDLLAGVFIGQGGCRRHALKETIALDTPLQHCWTLFDKRSVTLFEEITQFFVHLSYDWIHVRCDPFIHVLLSYIELT
ncbi:hypothetical protein C448_05878 [Halococcus morrhuae DSM 1307]|uniref:Uncharacterized protein n=1 Tax=Halococcus morrhuae DSM 1307 TaxID=931277 RepID=M0MLP8_HALMO|nr:hypothetical protein C448_05878 [Halococcus morrhuae DSM 1307]